MKDNEKKYCSLCMEAAPEDAAILALGRLGYPRYLCDRCDALLSTATSSRDFSEISRAFDELGERIAKGANDDEIAAEAIADILSGAKARAEAIKDGSYDFTAENEAESNGDMDSGIECDSEGLPFECEEEPEEKIELTEEEKLEAEGHTIVQKGRKNIRYYVKDYEDFLETIP